MNQTINYQEMTRLPVEVLAKADQMSPIIKVTTPTGTVIVELKEVEKGIFRKASMVDVDTRIVLNKLRDLESESMDFLLEKWLETN